MGKRVTYKKKDRERFEKLMTETFEGEFVIPTIYGPYEVRGIKASENVLTVFGAFQTTDKEVLTKANKHLYSNQYNGKWNFHYCGESVDRVISLIKIQIDMVRI